MAHKKLIANLGDRDPFSYGGYLVFKNGRSYEGVYWDSPDSDDEPTSVYGFEIPADVFKEHNWAKPEQISSFVGADAADLVEMGRSSNVLERANVMRDIGHYHGFNNFDSYAHEMTVRELKRQYGRAVDGLYKREGR